ncbi:hypothetical protein [Aeoliella sp. SH292]|uniref:hypothetical protein n=1 Tax=Aeoliella sp. SH292 TaxID=3454464 RepID=UPI003F948FED
MNRLTLALLVATFAFAPTATHAATAIWIGPENGSWSDPANWSTGAVPGNQDSVVVDNDPLQTSVLLTATEITAVDSLRVDAYDELTVTSNVFFADNTQLAGTIRIAPGGRFDTTGPLLIESTGQVVLTEGAPAQLTSTGTPASLWWNQGMIRGAGTVRPQGTFLNEGTLSADVAASILDIQPYAVLNSTILTNSGLAQAVGGGELRFRYSGSQPTTIQQPGNIGRIEAGPLSKVTLERILLEGGSLASLSDASGSGVVDTTDTAFDNVAFEGTINATRGTLAGSISNSGTFQVLQNVTFARETVELSGGGVVQLANPSTALPGATIATVAFGGSPNFARLRNHDNTIRGAGRITLNGSALDNRGIIETGFGSDDLLDHPHRNLSVEQAMITNTGLLRATANATLGLSNSTVTNYNSDTRGVIEAQPGGTVELWATTIQGGILRAIPAEQGSMSSDGVVRFVTSTSRLSNLRLEGNIGTSTNQVTVDGRIEIDGTLRATELYLAASTQFVGGVVALGENGGQLRLATGVSSSTPVSLTLSDTTLRIGSVTTPATNLQIDNRGAIVAIPNATASLSPSQVVVNSGLIHAQAGARLALFAIETPQAATGAELRVDAGGVISTTRLVGGKVVSAPGTNGELFSGSVTISNSSSTPLLQDVVNEGLIQIQSGQLAGIIENHGVVEFSFILGTFSQRSSLLQFTGTGELRLLGRQLQRSSAPAGVTFLNGPQHTIRTHGRIDYLTATFINEGTVQADTGTLTVSTQARGSFIQHGTLRTVGTNTLYLDLSQSFLDNDGQFDISPTGTIAIAGTQQINNRSESDIFVDGTLATNEANLTNDAGATIRGGGTIVSTGDTTLNQSILTNHGLVAPGSTVGDLQVQGNFVQSASGILEIDVNGFETGEFDQLLIGTITPTSGGLATLAGTLDFNFAAELIPALGDELVVLTAKQITGMFDSIEGLPTLAAGLDWQIDYLPTMVMATVIGLTPPNLAGDFNGDGFVNLADYTVWRDGLGDTHSTSDYDLWKQNFGRSANDPTPEANGPAAVPEPTTALLALAFLPLLARRAWR